MIGYYYSAVPDYIDLNYNGYHWFVFNVADIFISIGILMLILTEFLKKMKNKIIFLIVLMYFISSCSGFGVKRSDKADEFLIEKKAPLVMPPDIEDLPEPQGINKKINLMMNLEKY